MVSALAAFLILWIAMYLSIKIINFIFAISNLSSQPKATLFQKTEDKNWWERIIEASLEYLQWTDFSDSKANSVSACEIEVGAVCGEVVANIEGLEEGIGAIVESTGEQIFSAIAELININ